MTERNDGQPIRWPKPNEPLFIAATGTGWPTNACVGFSRGQWHAYVSGFRDSAIALGDRLIARQGTLDTEVFPFVFLWRQNLELSLKWVILLTEKSLAGHEHHRLHDLWPAARDAINNMRQDILDFGNIDTTELDDTLSSLDEKITEFAATDEYSFNFRYPVEKGLATLPCHPFSPT